MHGRSCWARAPGWSGNGHEHSGVKRARRCRGWVPGAAGPRQAGPWRRRTRPPRTRTSQPLRRQRSRTACWSAAAAARSACPGAAAATAPAATAPVTASAWAPLLGLHAASAASGLQPVAGAASHASARPKGELPRGPLLQLPLRLSRPARLAAAGPHMAATSSAAHEPASTASLPLGRRKRQRSLQQSSTAALRASFTERRRAGRVKASAHGGCRPGVATSTARPPPHTHICARSPVQCGCRQLR
jgi:hypothetical protein